MDEAELVVVFTGSPRDAEMLRAALAGSGIEATIQASGIGGAYPVNVGDLAKTTLLVRAEDAEDARAIIAAGDSQMVAEPEDAPSRHRLALILLATVVVIALVAGFVAAELRSLIP